MNGHIFCSCGRPLHENECYKDEKELKGYQYDSLVYRYIRAREAIAQWEWERDHQSREREWYFQQANRDIARFCQILHEAIGEHN